MILEELLKVYPEYRHPYFTHRRFKHAEILPLIEECGFPVQQVASSYEGRKIHKITAGTGSRPILLWSQMHGNEATATMAIFDILNYLRKDDSGFAQQLLEVFTLHFVPMINPDGAQRFTRRTAQQIDMNRDALALACPESVLLKKLVKEIKPEFSFNLHDQNVRYAAGLTPNQAAISFLATAYNEAREWNETRTKAMQVISHLNEGLQKVIPNRVGRFSDEFEPRAFGDNIQKWGSSLILVESGGNGEDTEKMKLRELNFAILLSALASISSNSYQHYQLQDYERIPTNEKCLFDLLIRNCKLDGILMDIGVNVDEVNNDDATDYTLTSTIEDMGDLSTFCGIKEFEANGAEIETLSGFSEKLTKYKLQESDFGRLEFEKKANFALVKNQKPLAFVINGQLIEA